jgi:hypothetical protein
MTRPLDLSLPDTVPEMANYHDQEAYDGPFAIYTLCDVDEDGVTDIVKTCESDCGVEGQVVRPPHHRFPGGRLRDIVEYHVELARNGQFDPKYFMVVACLEWRTKGVVIVALDDEEMQCKPDLLWINAKDAGLALVNLQLSNMSWEEFKEDSLESPAPDDEMDDGDVDQDEDFGKAPSIGYHIGVYVRNDLDAYVLLREIEPAVDIKQPSEIVCKALKAIPENETSQGDLVSRAAIAHPVETSRHPTLHKRMFLVADNLDYSGAGLSLVELDWDGETDGKSDEELREIGKATSVDRISVGTHASAAGDWAAVFVFSRIAEKGGLSKWRPKHVLVGVYSIPYPDCDIKVQSAIDPRWDRRGSGQDRAIYAGSLEATDEVDTLQVYGKLSQTHLRFCRHFRFATNLCRGYFVYCSKKDLEAEDEVTVIKVLIPAEDILQVEESDLPDNGRGQVETLKCQALEAHALITDLVKGKKKWRGVCVET